MVFLPRKKRSATLKLGRRCHGRPGPGFGKGHWNAGSQRGIHLGKGEVLEGGSVFWAVAEHIMAYLYI